MYLITEKEWELNPPFLKALPDTASRLFSCVEVDLNVPLWHLDLLLSAGPGVEYWRRFVLTSLEQAIATAAEYPGRSQLHFQSARSSKGNKRYVLWPVKKVLAGCYSDGLNAHMLVFPHGREIYPNSCTSDTEFTSTKCVYESKSLDSSP